MKMKITLVCNDSVYLYQKTSACISNMCLITALVNGLGQTKQTSLISLESLRN